MNTSEATQWLWPFISAVIVGVVATVVVPFAMAMFASIRERKAVELEARRAAALRLVISVRKIRAAVSLDDAQPLESSENQEIFTAHKTACAEVIMLSTGKRGELTEYLKGIPDQEWVRHAKEFEIEEVMSAWIKKGALDPSSITGQATRK